MEPILDIRHLNVSFGATHLVKDVSFSLMPGKRLGIVGESGSGKSLTALSIMRLAPGATLSGEVRLGGQDLLRLPEKRMQEIRGRRIGMVYQDPMSSLNPVHTVGKQITEALRLHAGMTARQASVRAIELLEMVGVPAPEERVNQYPHQFSGGMRQRAMIAIAMSAAPDVLICDEATTALDVTTQAKIVDLLDTMAAEHGTAVIMITHDLGVAAGFCDDILVMRQGEFIERESAVELYASPKHDYTRALLDAVVDIEIDVTKPIPTPGGTSRSLAVPEVPSAPVGAGPLLRVEGVSKSFRLGRNLVNAVSGVSFEINRGETFGLVGESGSGKSTVSRVVLNLLPPDDGTVHYDGHGIHTLKSREMRSLRRHMQMVFQDPFSALNRRQTVEQIIKAPLETHRVGTRSTRNAKVDEMLTLVGLDPSFRTRLPRSLSGGQCQRVAIARALALDPSFLILDESVSSLDVSIQAQVLNLLKDLQRVLGLTYLFISHDLAVVRYMSDRIAVMRKGAIVESGTRTEIFTNPQHPYTQQLLTAVPVADPVRERAKRSQARSDAQLASAQ